MAARGFDEADVAEVAELVHEVLTDLENTSNNTYALDPALRARVQERIRSICHRRPVAGY
jgi:glycine hydroxymethyltransferase